MKKHTKKLIAPIIITVLIVSYFVFYMWMGLFISEIPSIMKMLLLVFPVGLIALSVYMLFERVKEIKDGEEDDLSKY
ncbi:hypothetical protein TICRE_06320 [Tissierella creatinophila DSM 6911]|uniref:Uncharacterized protein n=1 Tax=Tissierella creatinophila DSM 6911 TaxID=1123403 RepID=A0A1U7M7W2_TISCR|nr:hypothetical protein TICRE_06320 [Tissierella creatinophila DSM 6911]